jgi:phospholipid N-methyltransferase
VKIAAEVLLKSAICDPEHRDRIHRRSRRFCRITTCFLALEPNARIVEGCTTELRLHAAEHEFDGTRNIVSGLPWTIVVSKLQRTILGSIQDALGKGGAFARCAYGLNWMPSGENIAPGGEQD